MRNYQFTFFKFQISPILQLIWASHTRTNVHSSPETGNGKKLTNGADRQNAIWPRRSRPQRGSARVASAAPSLKPHERLPRTSADALARQPHPSPSPPRSSLFWCSAQTQKAGRQENTKLKPNAAVNNSGCCIASFKRLIFYTHSYVNPPSGGGGVQELPVKSFNKRWELVGFVNVFWGNVQTSKAQLDWSNMDPR